MNTSRMILVLLACFALQACGGGSVDEDEEQPAESPPTTCTPAQCQNPR